MSPRATYRLQFHKVFAFDAARPLAPYLARLGISHVYSSPILKSRAGSRHGYDVIDHATIDAELGGEEGFRRLAAALREHGIRIILDIVPNHMAVHRDNRWWMDVLEHGRASRFAHYFDIDWDALGGKVLTAFLGQPYWHALEAGDIRIVRDEALAKTCVAYFDWRFPLRPEDQQAVGDGDATPEALHALLERQHYRLAWWRTANDEINWRRFFDIPDLISLNQEHEDVFEATHTKIFALFAEGLIDGVRVDHTDGLADPPAYCRRLRARLDALARERAKPLDRPYIVVEKILGMDEDLPRAWGMDGTTGYDFMNEVSALQHDPAGAGPLANLWHRISGRSPDFAPEEAAARHEILRRKFESALLRTAQAFLAVAKNSCSARDVPLPAVRRALARIIEHLRVYRTYATGRPQSEKPGAPFEQALDAARRHASTIDAAAIDFVAEVVRGALDRAPDGTDAARRFNQLSAPVAAKAVEDTAFYRYGRLLSRNDVGSNPGIFSIGHAEFHARTARRAATFPHALLATATHDHKRGEDVRARLAALSEIPEEWAHLIETWFAQNARHRTPGLDAGEEYQLYQTLVGAWPLGMPIEMEPLSAFCKRILGWRLKSLHEAKLRTSWTDPDEAYEKENETFVRSILNPDIAREFLDSLSEFVSRIAPAGALNGLVQTTLRCTLPGVPDCYQGAEFWDLSLVDPDNRRAVDYRARAAALDGRSSPPELLASWREGQVKQALIAALLGLRKTKPQVFSEGEYLPLEVRGSRADRVVAFLRVTNAEAVLVTVPLRCARACSTSPHVQPTFWGNTEVVLSAQMESRRWTHLFDESFCESGAALSVRTLFARFPIAVLT
jgi:(1->4)-alpha-D-glucan 1-alpha-D-glucosylmutase